MCNSHQKNVAVSLIVFGTHKLIWHSLLEAILVPPWNVVVSWVPWCGVSLVWIWWRCRRYVPTCVNSCVSQGALSHRSGFDEDVVATTVVPVSGQIAVATSWWEVKSCLFWNGKIGIRTSDLPTWRREWYRFTIETATLFGSIEHGFDKLGRDNMSSFRQTFISCLTSPIFIWNSTFLFNPKQIFLIHEKAMIFTAPFIHQNCKQTQSFQGATTRTKQWWIRAFQGGATTLSQTTTDKRGCAKLLPHCAKTSRGADWLLSSRGCSHDTARKCKKTIGPLIGSTQCAVISLARKSARDVTTFQQSYLNGHSLGKDVFQSKSVFGGFLEFSDYFLLSSTMSSSSSEVSKPDCECVTGELGFLIGKIELCFRFWWGKKLRFKNLVVYFFSRCKEQVSLMLSG